MSAATPTKIFGIRIGVDPKILVGGLVALAVLLFWYNSRSDEGGGNAPVPATAHPADTTPIAGGSNSAGLARTAAARRGAVNLANNRNRLVLRPIDATKGDVDPTLRLDLLGRLSAVQFEPARRSLFDIGPAAPPPSQATQFASIKGPIIPPRQLQSPNSYPPTSTQLPLNIPLKYYGFVKPTEPGQANRGFFLDALDKDNILVASEGQVLNGRYLVVELGPNTARLEDTQAKKGQVLPVVPAALQQQ